MTRAEFERAAAALAVERAAIAAAELEHADACADIWRSALADDADADATAAEHAAGLEWHRGAFARADAERRRALVAAYSATLAAYDAILDTQEECNS
jgi:hypothetical protein